MQTFYRAIIVFDYKTHTEFYAKKCENKAKPKLKCNGKCQMMKKLKQEDKKDRENPDRKAENKNEISVLSSRSFIASIGLSKHFIEKCSFVVPLKLGYELQMPDEHFHPPC